MWKEDRGKKNLFQFQSRNVTTGGEDNLNHLFFPGLQTLIIRTCVWLQGTQLTEAQETVQSHGQTFPQHSLRDLQPMVHLSSIDWVQQVWNGGASQTSPWNLQLSRSVRRKVFSCHCSLRRTNQSSHVEHTAKPSKCKRFPLILHMERLCICNFSPTQFNVCSYIYPPFSCIVKHTCFYCGEKKRMNFQPGLASGICLIQLCRSYIGLVNYSLSVSKCHNLGFFFGTIIETEITHSHIWRLFPWHKHIRSIQCFKVAFMRFHENTANAARLGISQRA